MKVGAVVLGLLLAVGHGRVLAQDPNERTFEVTVTDESGSSVQGNATATLTDSNASTGLSNYTLARAVSGTSAAYSTGTASIDAKTLKISVVFAKSDPGSDTTPGIANSIDGGSGSSDTGTTPAAGVQISLSLVEPPDPNVHLFTASWSADGHTFQEQWRELTNTVKGVDVSAFQQKVDWATVKKAGVGFGIARVSDGLLADGNFAQNWAAMRSVGIVRGAYQFFRASKDPIAQADLYAEKVGAFLAGDLPPFLDAEVMDGVDAATFVKNMKAWLDEVEAKTGRRAAIYTGAPFWNALGSPDVGSRDLWIAEYPKGSGPPPATGPGSAPKLPTAWKTWKFWQYSPQATFPGIPHPVDVSLFNGNLQDLLSYAWSSSSAPATDAGLPSPAQPAAKVTISQTLRMGMQGVEVTALQLALGFTAKQADGDFGQKTFDAVQAFQKAHPPLGADGIAGPATLQALGLQ